ncbi:putative adipose-regulatory protein-domain-containing protein [Halenospora varia]|nr:putative adipose-regulatory protein-domain-containing protein [Halenospora varia]
MDIVLKPLRVATSKPAQKTYLNAILFTITSTILLGLAIVAYGLFYYNYVPQINIDRIIHLQYGDGPHPYGIVCLDSSLISQQAYDITLDLHVPRSPTNLETGNFMLSLSLLAKNYKLASNPPTTSTTVTPPLQSTIVPFASNVAQEDILFSSRRPALLTYTSRLVSLSERLFQLPLYILGLRREDETLSIPMAESTSFPRGWKNIPAFAMLELQAGQNIQVYDVKIRFTARFGGLRWWMWNHRLLAALVGVSVFWGAEVVGCAVAWVVLMGVFGGKPDAKTETIKGEETDGIATIKDEPETDDPDLSDTPRTFPTYGRQPPLKFVPTIKRETDSDEFVIDETAIQPLAAEADDEDDDEGGFRGFRSGADRGNDSGLGTSFSERGEGSGLARRRSKGGRS